MYPNNTNFLKYRNYFSLPCAYDFNFFLILNIENVNNIFSMQLIT